MNDIHLNPNLTSGDKIAGLLFLGFFLLLGGFVAFNALNAWLRERGYRCFWCKTQWVGRGCACIPRWGQVGYRGHDKGSEFWEKLSYEGKLAHAARFAHRKYLETRRNGRRGDAWCWQSRREAYLRSLRLYRESRGAAVR